MAADPRQSVDGLHGWLNGKGVAVARSSVGRYMLAVRRGSPMREWAGIKNDKGMRRRLAAEAAKLKGEMLGALVLTAMSMARAVETRRACRRKGRQAAGGDGSNGG